MTYPELRLLQRYANEAQVVLEIGTHYGFTCIGMALAGAHVTSVDPHYEGPADKPDTWEPFLANLKRHNISRMFGQVPGAVAPYRMAIQDAPPDDGPFHLPIVYLGTDKIAKTISRTEPGWPKSLPISFGLVFIDGDHAWPAPMRDSQIARTHLRAPGYLAFHDVTPNWPGVYRTTEELTRSGEIVKLAQVGTLAVYQVASYQK